MIKINNNQNFESYDFTIPPQDTEQFVNAEIVTVNAIEIHPLPLNSSTNCINYQSGTVDDNNRPDIEDNVNYPRIDYAVFCCGCCPPSHEAAMCYIKCCTFCMLSIFLFIFILLVSFFSSKL